MRHWTGCSGWSLQSVLLRAAARSPGTRRPMRPPWQCQGRTLQSSCRLPSSRHGPCGGIWMQSPGCSCPVFMRPGLKKSVWFAFASCCVHEALPWLSGVQEHVFVQWSSMNPVAELSRANRPSCVSAGAGYRQRHLPHPPAPGKGQRHTPSPLQRSGQSRGGVLRARQFASIGIELPLAPACLRLLTYYR